MSRRTPLTWWRRRRARHSDYQRQLAQLEAITAEVGRSVRLQMYAHGFGRTRRHLAEMSRAIEEVGWQLRLRRERTAARAALDALVDEAWARYGWERPA